MPRSCPPPSINERSCDAGILATNVERADTFRTVYLVSGNREQVDVVRLYVHGNFSDGLHGVHVEENAAFLGDFPDFADRLDNADFVVRVHRRDQNRLRDNRAAEIVERDATFLIDRKVGDLIALVLKPLATIEHRLVLGHLCNDVISLLPVPLRNALDREVVRFGRTAREHDFLGHGVDQPCDLTARIFDCFLSSPAEFVIAARGVAKFIGEIRQHRFEDPRVDRCRGLIVHIDGKLDRHSSLSKAPHNHSSPLNQKRPLGAKLSKSSGSSRPTRQRVIKSCGRASIC